MSADRFAEVERLYHEATRRRPEERAAFLDKACAGDDALRHEVESLLSLPTDAGEFLSRTALEEAARAGHRPWEPASWPTIPGYTVRRVLGEGGMGVVYLAEQATPLRRLVALKLIKPGMDTRQVVARFETERQALALMDHPNIAAVFDAGSTDNGRPYFVMEYVDGVSMTEYCDRRRLSTHDRLAVFVQVCAAVQHAHQKGVIHRDLKPSNVLVTERDGQPLPKVIDFGTAKAVEGAWNATATQGGQGMVLGTLEYMSPEQAALSADIDTATDVYSLGVLLYELLVGRLPFDTDELRAAGYDEIRRVIRESDPPKPSVRVEHRSDKSGAAARARQTDAPGLTRQLRGDLDWITLKALEKDRKRRYATVAAFATDIGRFLDDQPVDARPPSSTYRIRKFTRRHRGAVAAAVTLFVVLVAGLAGSLTQYVRAEDARIEAVRHRAQAESERSRADLARTGAEDATAKANKQTLEAERQSLIATQEAQRARQALDLSDFRNYVITIAAADAEVQASRFSNAREQLFTVPVARRGWEWDHLFQRTEKTLLTLADRAPCSSAQLAGISAFTGPLVTDSNGKRIYFSHCGRVNSWNTETLEHLVAVSSPNVIVAVAPSGRRVEYVLASDKTTPQPEKKWNVHVVDSSGVRSPTLTLDREPACHDLSRDGRILALGLRPFITRDVATADGFRFRIETDVFEVWDVKDGRRISRVEHPTPPFPEYRFGVRRRCSVRLSPDTTHLATSGAVVRLWVAATGAPVHADWGQAGYLPQAIAFRPDGRQLAIGRRNGLIDVIDVMNSNWIAASLGGAGVVVSLDGTDVVRGRPLNERDRSSDVMSESYDAVRAIDFAPDGRTLVSATSTRVIAWDLKSTRVFKVLDTHQSPVTGLVVHEHLVYSSHEDGTVKVEELEESSGVTKLEGSIPLLASSAMSVDGRALAWGSMDGSVTVWHPDERREVLLRLAPETHRGGLRVKVVVPLADNRTILTGLGPLGSLRRWDFETRQSVSLPTMDRTELGCMPDELRGAALSPNDRYLAIVQGHCVIVRDLTTGKTMANLPLDRRGFYASSGSSVRFLSDETILVGARHHNGSPPFPAGFNSVKLWDWKTNRLTADRLFPMPTAIPFALTVSKDGRRIALGDRGLATVWDGALAREIGRIPILAENASFDRHRLASGHVSTPGKLNGNPVMALSPDGSRLAIAMSDQPSVKIWDTTRPQLLLTLTNDHFARFLQFTPSGQLIAVNSSGGVTIWETQRPKCPQCPKIPGSVK